MELSETVNDLTILWPCTSNVILKKGDMYNSLEIVVGVHFQVFNSTKDKTDIIM